MMWPNNSFKPTPCHGIGHVLCATLAHVRRPATGRLNSGVRPHMKSQQFLMEVATALAGCQAVELELKLYISQAFFVVRSSVGERLPFKFSGEDYTDASLERLIDAFKKLSDNDELIKRLNQFKGKRNHLAHKAIADCLDDVGDFNEWAAAEAYATLSTIQRDADKLLNDIAKEHQKLYVIESGIPIPPDAA